MNSFFKLTLSLLKNKAPLILIVGSIYGMYNKCIELAENNGYKLKNHLIAQRLTRNGSQFNEHILEFT